ncbi:MAG: hypothetical protein ACREDK_00940 [Thermoplasmata archaeon]
MVELWANASGGFPPYTFAWNLPEGTATGSPVHATVATGENLSVTLYAYDATGVVTERTGTVPLGTPSCPPPVPGNSSVSSPAPGVWRGGTLTLLAALGGGAVVFGGGWAWFARYRRGRPPAAKPDLVSRARHRPP